MTNNPCTRCGKERIVIKKWKEKVGDSYVYCTSTSCPDKNCQSMVDKELANQKEKRDELAREKEQREKAKIAEKKERAALSL